MVDKMHHLFLKVVYRLVDFLLLYFLVSFFEALSNILIVHFHLKWLLIYYHWVRYFLPEPFQGSINHLLRSRVSNYGQFWGLRFHRLSNARYFYNTYALVRKMTFIMFPVQFASPIYFSLIQPK